MKSDKVVSVNVGRPRAFEHNGKSGTSSIWKSPVEGRVAVRGVNVEGDDQADREVHGGPDKTVYTYALEDVRFWESELACSLELAALGENVTTEGLDVTNAVVGARWKIGSAEFRGIGAAITVLEAHVQDGRPDVRAPFHQGWATRRLPSHRA